MYSFKIENADDFLTPRVDQGATHALKLRDQHDAKSSTTDVHGLTTTELVGLYYAVAERLSETYSDAGSHLLDNAPPRGAW